MKKMTEKDVFDRINVRGFKIYLGKSSLDTVVFSPKGEELGCILGIEISQDAKDVLRKIKLTGLANIITEQEKDELIELNKINKKEMNG
jgi:hypothetical protein